MPSGHFVSSLNISERRQLDLDSSYNARLKLVSFLAIKDPDADDAAAFSVRNGERGVFNIPRLFSKDCPEKPLFRS